MGDRHQFRAKWHDYNGGVYFVTICSHQKHHTFGSIVGTRLIASALGKIIEEYTMKIPEFYSDVELLNHVIMPNHVHLVLTVGTRLIASDTKLQTIEMLPDRKLGCLNKPMYGVETPDYHHNCRLANIIGAYKAGVTRTARTRRIASLPVDTPIWQSRYHEHIIKNQIAFDNIMNYIDKNIENWNKDCFYG